MAKLIKDTYNIVTLYKERVSHLLNALPSIYWLISQNINTLR